MVGIGIIGYGHMSRGIYCPLLHEFAGRLRLAALVEPDEQRRLPAGAASN